MHSSDNRDNKALKLPSVGAVLDNIPGGQENLLPSSALTEPLRIDVPMWLNSEPSPTEPEHLYLYWNNVKVAEKTWTQPVLPSELILWVEQRHLNAAGIHLLHYEVMTYNGDMATSDPLRLTITSPPALGGDQGRLLFDNEVVNDGITTHYLETHGDKVQAQVPVYNKVWPGDTLSWYWDEALYTDNWVSSRTLTQADASQPLMITFEGHMIRERGEGDRFAHYKVEDRAGNNSGHSRPFNVQVIPAPRNLPWAIVDGATGTGNEVVLDPFDALEGATVVIADTVVLKPNELLWIQWGEPGSLGAFRTSTPISTGQRRYKIPKREVALNIDKVLPVYYEIATPDGLLRSDIRQLKVMALAIEKLPLIKSPHVFYQNGQAFLKFNDIPPEGLELTLEPWPLIMLDQHAYISAITLTPTGGKVFDALPKRQLTPHELTSGLGKTNKITVPKSWFEILLPELGFHLMVYISFDSGITWPTYPNFPSLHVLGVISQS